MLRPTSRRAGDGWGEWCDPTVGDLSGNREDDGWQLPVQNARRVRMEIRKGCRLKQTLFLQNNAFLLLEET